MNNRTRRWPGASAAKRGIGLLIAFLLVAVPVVAADRANSYSTRAQKEIDLMLSADAYAGIRVYLTTASLPTCASLRGKGAPFAYDAEAATVKVCNGTIWTAVSGGAGVFTSVTVGTVTTAGRAICSIDDVMGGGSATDGFENCTGTMPTVLTAAAHAVNFQITGAGSSAQTANAFNVNYLAGYTGASFNAAASFVNANLGTGNSELGAGATYGSYSSVTASGSNYRIAGMSHVTGDTSSVSIAHLAYNAGGNSASKIGLAARTAAGGTNAIALLAQYDDMALLSAIGKVPFVASNGTQATDIFRWYDNTTMKGRALDGGNLEIVNNQVTASTMTAENNGIVGQAVHSFTWTNAQVVALGAGLVGDINVATLPAKTVVRNAYVVITGSAAGPATVTVSCGDAIAGTPFINYVVASDAKAAANTVYGDAVAERGTSIDVEFYYLPSYTATTLVTCHFISTGANLNTVTGSTGRVILETVLLP